MSKRKRKSKRQEARDKREKDTRQRQSHGAGFSLGLPGVVRPSAGHRTPDTGHQSTTCPERAQDGAALALASEPAWVSPSTPGAERERDREEGSAGKAFRLRSRAAVAPPPCLALHPGPRTDPVDGDRPQPLQEPPSLARTTVRRVQTAGQPRRPVRGRTLAAGAESTSDAVAVTVDDAAGHAATTTAAASDMIVLARPCPAFARRPAVWEGDARARARAAAANHPGVRASSTAPRKLPAPRSRDATTSRAGRRPRGRWPGPLWLVVCMLLCVWGAAAASAPPPDHPSTRLRSTRDRLARRGEVVMDRRPSPLERRPEAAWELQRRQLFNNAPPSASRTATAAVAASTSTGPGPGPTAAPSATAPSSTSSAPASSSVSPDPDVNSPLPKPFDTNLGANFTSNNCPNFFQQFLGTSDFNGCLPLSLLLRVCAVVRVWVERRRGLTPDAPQSSNSFFQAAKSLVRITQTLDATCNVNFSACSSLMSRIALDLQKDANCGPDLKNQNPVVMQAYSGLIAYQPLYRAGCLKSATGSYCFADAVTNTSSPTDNYVYFLPIGIGLPGGSRPSCTACLQNTMSVFATAASNVTQPVSQNYVAAAQLIDLGCGPTFVNTTVPPAKAGAAAPLAARAHSVVMAGAILAALLSLTAAHAFV
ncbi:MAG: hypothetical protein M1826_002948 [Phylliscum demangeonii]|nr:MAG: hypothetical protein M1826_002948 [Phylliscum demangeonii]